MIEIPKVEMDALLIVRSKVDLVANTAKNYSKASVSKK